MIAVLLLNAFVFPGLLQNEVKEVGYNEFLSMVDSGKVAEVSRDEAAQTITFTSVSRTTRRSTIQDRHLAG